MSESDQNSISKSTFSKNDVLGRSEFAKRLTDLVDNAEQPLVLALDGNWGSGKTTFLHMWKNAHETDFEGVSKLVFFDAFEHDFLDDPLTSLVYRIIDQRKGYGKSSSLTKLKTATKAIVKPVARIGLAIASYGATELAGAAVDEAIKATAKEVDNKIGSLWEGNETKIKAMETFKEALSELVSGKDGEEPKLTIIIDELDRCRPDYALLLLEHIKHFFDQPRIHFILGVNLSMLENAVTARYGAGIDATQYLKKFINVTSNIESSNYQRHEKNSNPKKYLEKCCEKYDIPSDIKELTSRRIGELTREKYVSLRDIDQLCFALSLLPSNISDMYHGYQEISVTSIIARQFAPPIYKKILAGTVTVTDIGVLYGYCDQNTEFNRPTVDSASPKYNHQKMLIWSLWTRLTQFPCDEKTLDQTRNAFGGFTSDVYEDTLRNFAQDSVETWHLV
ncbi:KAP family P-loop NTPase fold protein [Litoreibacter meonggei]|uniref:KAP family P-loop NTPase fold protein n=1 Tax=Litoreibacter meonggei TaxID=1049199 RepID=UPI0014760D61|nr:P-loop NTPase fold protein [Litoreibacter meonggei]